MSDAIWCGVTLNVFLLKPQCVAWCYALRLLLGASFGVLEAVSV